MALRRQPDDSYVGKHANSLDAVVPYRSTLQQAKGKIAFAAMIAVAGAGFAGAAGYSDSHRVADAAGQSVITRPVEHNGVSRSTSRTPLSAESPSGPSTAVDGADGKWTLSEDADEMAANLEAQANAWDANQTALEKLKAKINDANGKKQSDWTADSWSALQAALNAASKQAGVSLNDGKAADYDKSASDLQAAIDGLEEKPKPATSNSGSASAGSSDGGSLGTTAPVGEMQEWFHDYLLSNGCTEADFAAGVWIINHESGWNPRATNPSSGAYGLPQSLPGGKMASAGADWQTNYQTQLKWFVSYCDRYGGIQGAYDFWQTHHWY